LIRFTESYKVAWPIPVGCYDGAKEGRGPAGGSRDPATEG